MSLTYSALSAYMNIIIQNNQIPDQSCPHLHRGRHHLPHPRRHSPLSGRNAQTYCTGLNFINIFEHLFHAKCVTDFRLKKQDDYI